MFLWNKIEGYTQKEIAEKLDLTPSSVEKYMKRALRHLQKKLQNYAPHWFRISLCINVLSVKGTVFCTVSLATRTMPKHDRYTPSHLPREQALDWFAREQLG
ncbi:RNA polymerase sigma factor, partial [Alcaligenes pakistanensis]